jgi:hypothetical protein
MMAGLLLSATRSSLLAQAHRAVLLGSTCSEELTARDKLFSDNPAPPLLIDQGERLDISQGLKVVSRSGIKPRGRQLTCDRFLEVSSLFLRFP